jgi:cell division protein ZapA
MEQEGVRVSIFDQVYYLKSGADRAYLEELARYVDHRMAAIAAKTQTVDSFRVAVLAALHIADELLRLRKEHERLQNQIESKSLEYAALLDQALKPAAG